MADVPYRINEDNVFNQPQSIEPAVVPQVFPPQPTVAQQFAAIQQPQVSSINMGQPMDQTVVYAGFGRRFLATIIDGFVVGLIEFAIMFSTGLVFGLVNLAGVRIMLGYILVLIAVLGYYIGFLVKKGATLGKMAMGIKVITVSGEPLTVGRVFLREIVGKFVSATALYIGFLSILWDPKKQGWHDKIAGTVGCV